MANTRLNFALAVAILLVFLMRGGLPKKAKTWTLISTGALTAFFVVNGKFDRFLSLRNTDMISDRISGSVNRSFIEVLIEFPLGNGLGGGGTSIPYFLAHQLRRPVSVENEYARVALELGIPGLLIWSMFLLWILRQGLVRRTDKEWNIARKLVLIYLLGNFATALIGTGLLTAIPLTPIMFLWSGWISTNPPVSHRECPEMTIQS